MSSHFNERITSIHGTDSYVLSKMSPLREVLLYYNMHAYHLIPSNIPSLTSASFRAIAALSFLQHITAKIAVERIVVTKKTPVVAPRIITYCLRGTGVDSTVVGPGVVGLETDRIVTTGWAGRVEVGSTFAILGLLLVGSSDARLPEMLAPLGKEFHSSYKESNLSTMTAGPMHMQKNCS